MSCILRCVTALVAGHAGATWNARGACASSHSHWVLDSLLFNGNASSAPPRERLSQHGAPQALKTLDHPAVGRKVAPLDWVDARD
jgi:hypothetical protein